MRKRRDRGYIFKNGTGCRQDEKSGGLGQPTPFSCNDSRRRRDFFIKGEKE